MAEKKTKTTSKNTKSKNTKKNAQSQDHHGTKKFVFSLIVIFGLIGLLLFIITFPKSKETIVVPKQELIKETIPKEKPQIIVRTSEGEVSSDFNKDNLFNEIKQCITELEEKTKFDQEFIDSIITKDPLKCAGFERFCQAKINKDIAICDEIEDKNLCKSIILEEKALCKEDIICLAFTTKNQQYCNNLEELEKMLCQLIATRNIKEFESQKSTQKIKCSDNVYKKYAFLYEIPQLCDNIVAEQAKQECIQTISSPPPK